MRWVRDPTGRFPQRPYYERDELDQECEGIVSAFLKAKWGAISYPIATEDLVRLLTRETTDLDLYANFTDSGIEGVTDFVPGEKPRVRIASTLYEQSWRENRLRTTLTHELGHVKFHDLYSANQLPLPLFGSSPPIQCKRDEIIGAGASDWLEWQAGYASGAFLMPISAVKRIAGETVEEFNIYGVIPPNSPARVKLTERLQRAFQVSREAAHVRLIQLGLLGTPPSSASLF